MQPSPSLRDAVTRWYERRSAADVASFDLIVSREVRLFIGTAPGEWFEDREQLRRGFGYEGLLLEPGRVQAWEEGSLGWVADEPTMQLPGMGSIRTRMTAVFRREDAEWKLVMGHFSVGVPDAEVVELQGRWLGEPSG